MICTLLSLVMFIEFGMSCVYQGADIVLPHDPAPYVSELGLLEDTFGYQQDSGIGELAAVVDDTPVTALLVDEQPAPLTVFSGYGSMYSEGVMEATIALRVAGETYHSLPETVWSYDLWIAVLFSDWCYLIGQEVLVTFSNGVVELGMITDCGNFLHTERHLEMWRDGIVAELDYNTYQQYYDGGMPITVEIPSLRD